MSIILALSVCCLLAQRGLMLGSALLCPWTCARHNTFYHRLCSWIGRSVFQLLVRLPSGYWHQPTLLSGWVAGGLVPVLAVGASVCSYLGFWPDSLMCALVE